MERQRDLREREMVTIADILHPSDITLDVPAAREQEAIFQIASLLKEDDRVADWNAFYAALSSKNPCIAAGAGFEISIPHARTDTVKSMVMSVGRSETGVATAGDEPNTRYIFVTGIPGAFATDYLRVIGAIARVFKNEAAEKQLRATRDPAEFLEILSSREMAL